MMSQEEQEKMVASSVENQNGNGGVTFVKVMTDEQLETLRKQIVVYATISEQLVEMHNNLASQHDLSGGRLENFYCESLMTSASHKVPSRQRWSPTLMQLQILEHNFDERNGNPSKQKIREITSELSQYGPISLSNVYNWFQNRRSRSKRKQQIVAPNNAESQVGTVVDLPNKDKKIKPQNFHFQQNSALRPQDMCYESPDIGSSLYYNQIASYDDMLSSSLQLPSKFC